VRLRTAALHLLVLWAFAVAQPLFDLLGKNGEFFAARGSTRWDVVLFAFVLLLVPPARNASVPTIATVMTASTTAYSAMVWPRSLSRVSVARAWRRTNSLCM